MSTAAIVEDLERETAAEIERLLADAADRAAEVVAAAAAAQRRAVEGAVARAEPLARHDAARRVNAARVRLLDRRADLATARSEAVFEAAGRRLAAIAAGADARRWAAGLARLAGEALDLVGPGATLVVRPVDGALVADGARAAGAVLVPSEGAAPGVRASSADGRVEVDATIASRLERARASLAEAVAATLESGD
jgi:V/A-type H+-transporting ATPase subunit E